MGLPVNSPAEQLGGQNVTILRNPSTTRQTVFFPSGAVSLAISYRLLPGATATASQFGRLVINSSSDADAAGKLATDGAFLPIFQGDDIALGAPGSDPITRLDFLTSQAVGSEVTVLSIVAGVKS
jgi:hypothetical protein